MNHQNNNNNNNGMNQNGYGNPQVNYPSQSFPPMQSQPETQTGTYPVPGQPTQAFPTQPYGYDNPGNTGYAGQQSGSAGSQTWEQQPVQTPPYTQSQPQFAQYGSQQQGETPTFGQTPGYDYNSPFGQSPASGSDSPFGQNNGYGQSSTPGQNSLYGSGVSQYGDFNNNKSGGKTGLIIVIAIVSLLVLGAISALVVLFGSGAFGKNADGKPDTTQASQPAVTPPPVPNPAETVPSPTSPGSSKPSSPTVPATPNTGATGKDKEFCTVVTNKLGDLMSAGMGMNGMNGQADNGLSGGLHAKTPEEAKAFMLKLAKTYREIGDAASGADKQSFYDAADSMDKLSKLSTGDLTNQNSLEELKKMAMKSDMLGKELQMAMSKCGL